MHSTTVADRPEQSAAERDPKATGALRIAVAIFGVLLSLAGMEHGIGEILQGPVRPQGVVIASWPASKAFEILAGEPAMTLIPNLLAAGVLTVLVALALAIWSVWFIGRPYGGLVLIVLSLALLIVGGGFGPPLMGVIAGIAATRIGPVPHQPPGAFARALAQVWAWIVGAAVLGYLSLVPGIVVLGVDNAGLTYGLSAFSFTALIVALVAARAQDRVRAGATSRSV